MSNLKFRGLNKAGVWVYGDLIQTKPNKIDGDFTCWIKERSFLGLGAVSTPTAAFVEVETKTVGQFTGLKDKNGVEVCEGDIIQYGTPPTYQSSVFWSPQDFGFVTYNELLGEYTGLSFFTGYKNFEIVGNVHQNPELLEQNDE